MTKFTEKALTGFPMAFYYSAMQSFDNRIGDIDTTLQRLIQMATETHRLFVVFDTAYKTSQKSQLSNTIKKKDDERDEAAFVMERVAKLWAEKLSDDGLNIHGRRVAQVFKDFDFRPTEALVAENSKIVNMEQRFQEPQLQADLAAMGLTVLNERMAQLTDEIQQLMAQRNEEQSTVVVGEVKQAREALDRHYRAFITYLNAVQELQPEESISQAAQYYNQDIQKIEQQIAQSRRGGSVSQKPVSDGGTSSGGTQNGGSSNGSGTGSVTPVTPENGGSNGGGSNSGGDSPSNSGDSPSNGGGSPSNDPNWNGDEN